MHYTKNSTQACITAIGFPTSIDELKNMADWHEKESGRWETDLESLLSEDEGCEDDTPGYWTGARWLIRDDILFFYLSSERPIRNVRSMLSNCLGESDRFYSLLQRNKNLIEQYKGTVFGCGRVVGPTEYLAPDPSADLPHFSNRYFVPFDSTHIFENPVPLQFLNRHVKLSTGGSITPVLGEDFLGLKAELAITNQLPSYLNDAVSGGLSFYNISKQTWLQISCDPSSRFIDESQVRSYFLDYLLDEIKDSRTALLQECNCFRDQRSTGRADYFIQVGGSWIVVEAKMNILCEKDLLSQVERYINLSSFVPAKGRHIGRQFGGTGPLCLIGDQHGLYLTQNAKFIVGEPGVPGWKREELNADLLADIRSCIIEWL